MMLPSDTTLLDLLGEKVYVEVDSVMAHYRLGGLGNPAMRRMKPAALSSLLAVAMCREALPEFDPTQQLDTYFQLQAREAGKPVGGLETAQQQIKILYGAPLRRQAEQLACVVENADWNVALMKSLGDAYMRQDLDALEELMSQKLGGACDSTPEEDEMLVGGRNDVWMKQMPKIMEAHSTLFVVGVGHLVGERGLLRQLQNAATKWKESDKKVHDGGFLEVCNVTKRFSGHTALEGASLTARRGRVFGLLGPNGAGKRQCCASSIAFSCPIAEKCASTDG